MILKQKTKPSINSTYVKEFENGVLINPIDKYFPSGVSDRRTRRDFKFGRKFNNKKGIQLVITRISKKEFVKVKKRLQIIEASYSLRKNKFYQKRQVLHYD